MGFKDAWQRAGEPVDDYDPPNGTHNTRIVDTGAFAGQDGREWAKVTLEITSGNDTGRQFADFMNLNNDVGLRIARQNLTMYGLEDPEAVEDLDDLANQMRELIGTLAVVRVKHGGAQNFVNVTVVQARTGESDIPATPDIPVTAGTGDDDLPF